MTLQSLSAAAALAPIALRSAPVAAPEAAAARREDVSAGFDPRLGQAEALAAAAFAARALYDCRATGPSDAVAGFDRMALVIEGFEHLREVLDGVTQAAEEDFGPANGAQAGDVVQQALTAYGSLDIRV